MYNNLIIKDKAVWSTKMRSNILRYTLLSISLFLFGCDGTKDGDAPYGFVVHSDKPVEIENTTTVLTETIRMDTTNEDKFTIVDLLAGISIDGITLENDSTEVRIDNFTAVTVETMPILTLDTEGDGDGNKNDDERLYFGDRITDEVLGGESSYNIEPLLIDGAKLLINRHDLAQAEVGMWNPKDKKLEAVAPKVPLTMIKYTFTYLIDNGFPCVELDIDNKLESCGQFLTNKGHDLCQSGADSLSECLSHYAIISGLDETSCDVLENGNSCRNDLRRPHFVQGVVAALADDGYVNPNIKTLELTVTITP